LQKHLSKRKKYKKGLLLFGVLTFIIVLIVFAPSYLTYVDSPEKSDVVVLFSGNDFKARKKKTKQLIASGYSKYLVIPDYDKVFRSSNSGSLIPIKQNTLQQRKFITYRKKHDKGYFERTHIEVLHAKAMMDGLGFESAMFVSSPYHIRRVRMIANKIFNSAKYDLHFIPTRSEKINKLFWWAYKYDRNWVVNEYIKITWFCLYTYIPYLSFLKNST
jgi:hypothetical protein